MAQITFGGVDKTNNIRPSGYTVTRQAFVPATSSFSVVGRSSGYRPQLGQRAQLRVGSRLVFSGYVQRMRARYDRTELFANPHYAEIECVDEMAILNRTSVGERSWTATNGGEIVRQICAGPLAGHGIDYTAVEDGPEIPYVSFVYGSCMEAFRQIAEQCGFVFWLDFDRHLYFGPKSGVVAAYAPSTSANNFQTAEIDETQEKYANRVVARVAESLRDIDTQTFVATAGQEEFELAFACVAAPEVQEAGIDQPVEVDGNGGAAYYWTADSKTIRRDPTRPTLAAGTSVAITYRGIENIYVANQDLLAIAGRAILEDGTGVHEVFEDIAARVGRPAAQQYVDQKLLEYLEPNQVFSVVTNTKLDPDCELVQPGNQLNVNIPGLPAVGSYWVESVTLARTELQDGSDVHRVTINATKGGPRFSSVDFFRQIQNISASRGSIAGITIIGGGGGGRLPFVAVTGGTEYEPNLAAFSHFSILLNGVDCEILPAVGGSSGDVFDISLRQDVVGGRQPIWSSFYRGVAGIEVDGTAGRYSTFTFAIRDDGQAQLKSVFIGGIV